MDSYKTRIPQLALCIILTCIFSLRAHAGDIKGIAGYTLGEPLDKKLVLNSQKANDGANVYIVKLLKPEKLVATLAIRITQAQQIHRISAFSPVMTAVECENEMAALRKQTEKEFPALSYYAMDQSEMFYQDDRTYTLECVSSEAGLRLRQEYSDDKLAK